MVGDPSEYPWSSYLAYIGRERRWRWLCKDFILEQMDRSHRGQVSTFNRIELGDNEGVEAFKD